MLKFEATPPLNISSDKVCFLVVKGREYEGKDELTEPDPGSNASDDRMTSVLEEHGDDPVAEELKSFIDDLNEDEQIDLIALAWLGRDGGSLDDWATLRASATDAHNQGTASYLMGMPLFPDYLEEALSLFGKSCLEFETGHM